MKVTAVKTPKIRKGDDLYEILVGSITNLHEGSIVAITSKIVSICEGNLLPVESTEKNEMILSNSEKILAGLLPYGKTLTINGGILIPDAGIDESNGDGQYILWPADPYKSAEEIRKFLQKTFSVNDVGVVITDSKTTPLRWGTTGVGIAYSGFKPLRDYIGVPDLFGREMEATKANYLDGIAAAAVLVMGEGNEQTPIAILEELPFIEFDVAEPTQEEKENLSISMEEDIFAPILANKAWTRGKMDKEGRK